MELYKKLAKAKFDFHHTEVKKTGHNKFANYYYMQLADFTKPIVSLLHENGLMSFVSFNVEEATLTVVETETGESMNITSPMSKASLKGCHEVQNLGAVQTYIRRYLYCALFDIVEGDALDGSEPLKPTNLDCNELITIGNKKGFNSAKIEKSLIKSFGHGMQYITEQERAETIEKLKALDDK
jgi:hypothetical protein